MPTGGGLYAQDISDDTKLTQNKDNKSHYTYEFSTGDVVKTELGKTKLTNDENRIKHLTIKAGAGATALAFEGNSGTRASIGGDISNGYSFDLTADSVSFKGITDSGDTTINVGSGHSTINAKNGVTLEQASIDLANGNYFNKNFNGSLTINGDLKLTDSSVINNGQAGFNVNGKVTAKNTEFVAGVGDLNRVTNNGFFIMSATKGFENGNNAQKSFIDATSGNKGNVVLHDKLVNISSNLLDSKYAGGIGAISETDFAKIAPENDLSSTLYDTRLDIKGNSLYVVGDLKGFDANTIKNFKTAKDWEDAFKTLSTSIQDQFKQQKTNLEQLYKYNSNGKIESGIFKDNRDTVKSKIDEYNTEKTGIIAISQASVDSMKTALDEANKKGDQKEIKTAQENYDAAVKKLENDKKTLSELNNRLAEYNALIEDVKNKTANLDKKINDTNFNIAAGQKGQIFASLATSSVGGKLAGTADYIFANGKVINDVERAAQSNAGNSALNAPIGAINMSNDMAISNRLAKFSNPYSTVNVASLEGLKFAAGNGIASDSQYAYGARSYDNNVWANVIGGANIIDSKSGALYGVSVGYDRLVGEDTILGAYLTYADSKIKTSMVNQESDNLQLGLYSRTLYGNSEFDFKGYAQFGWTDQDRFIAGTVNSSDFTRKFLGASGTYGYVFDMGNDFYIKPLAGLNLYYSFTPDYNENGAYAQHVQSQSSFDTSIEAGAEFRKYLSKESYIYATPKIEQYIITSGDDYTARFLGSPTSFTINGSDKKKTYGSFIVGGDVNIKNQWAFTFSAGVKHLLSGKVNDESETYLSGNIGLKYQF
ncbi:TPA: autotransporter domain-containing protein [Campylobacter jejuni]|uniref:autotransporter family protein n=1 Tax=Campylobacter jejuni TaxID=197 RepID=UPI00126AC707|nr:autotransporter outer membrane beta-barrel domain-containing protein [Campylobacter jejuni]EAK3802395.1 autotransporter domain-containing protein [Campylobacter jejuni]HED4726299.1 autotransporter domain-containing protein [Campylobacter jejuni]HED5214105.1 autotransporter domain-containing protein [Campylobacter jejuni]HEF6509883.1 autotransporter domain-containing protein [Campylobacter jejuni]HEF6558844.1 autotransporter domain-containing protein [Campylobacter jejuni]